MAFQKNLSIQLLSFKHPFYRVNPCFTYLKSFSEAKMHGRSYQLFPRLTGKNMFLYFLDFESMLLISETMNLE